MSPGLKLETNPGGRVQLLPVPFMAPGKCVICGSAGGDELSSTKREFFDFQFDLDYYGVIYICTHCMTEAVNQVGWINHDQWHEVNRQWEEAELNLALAKTEIENLRNALNALGALNLSGGSIVNSDASATAPTNEAVKHQQPAPTKSSKLTKQGPAQSNDEPRPEDVPGTESGERFGPNELSSDDIDELLEL